MKPIMLYHKNGAVYECDTEERLASFLEDGWSKTKPKSHKEETPEPPEAPEKTEE